MGKILFRLMRSVYFNRVVYFYIFTATSNLFLPILNIFMHIPNYFHVYLYLYLTYLDIFSCIFIPIFMYIFTYFYIFLLISTYLLLFSTYFHQFIPISTYFLHIYLPASIYSNRLHCLKK